MSFPLNAAKGFWQSALPVFVLHFLLIMISLMGLATSARASGTLAVPPALQYSVSVWSYCIPGTIVSYPVASCSMQYVPISCSASSWAGLAPCVTAVAGGPVAVNNYYGVYAGGNPTGSTNPVTSHIGCPDHAQVTGNTCTCIDPYEPDASKTSCMFMELAISLSGESTTQPSASLPFNAVVTDQNGLAQAGKQVTITVDVQNGTGGHIHTENRPKGILMDGSAMACTSMFGPSAGTCTLTTGYNGQAPFLFVATPVSGTHTMVATCNGCGNTATVSVDVKVDNLIPIPASPLYALTDSTGAVIGAIPNKHEDNHYLTASAISRLELLATVYKTIAPSGKLYLNDGSLAWGGLFDVGATTWQPPHSLHDKGTSLDIRAENSGPNNEGAVPAKLFQKFIDQAHGKRIVIELHCKGSTKTEVCKYNPEFRHFHVDL